MHPISQLVKRRMSQDGRLPQLPLTQEYRGAGKPLTPEILESHRQQAVLQGWASLEYPTSGSALVMLLDSPAMEAAFKVEPAIGGKVGGFRPREG